MFSNTKSRVVFAVQMSTLLIVVIRSNSSNNGDRGRIVALLQYHAYCNVDTQEPSVSQTSNTVCAAPYHSNARLKALAPPGIICIRVQDVAMVRQD